MGIRVVLETNDRVAVAACEDGANLLHRILPGADDARFCYAGCIDWYGDTVINHLQAPRLVDELERLAAVSRDPDVVSLLARLAHLARRLPEERHLYLRFIGD